MSALRTLSRFPRATVELANIILTTPDAPIGQTPREVVWTHRGTTLYRYRSNARQHPVPILLVFALINRPEIFDLRRGASFVEFLLEQMYKENRLVDGRVRLRGERVDLSRIEQNLLVVTAGADHIAPPEGTVPLLALVCSEDVTHLERPGGHIGLMAGSKAKHEIWPELADWLREHSRN